MSHDKKKTVPKFTEIYLSYFLLKPLFTLLDEKKL